VEIFCEKVAEIMKEFALFDGIVFDFPIIGFMDQFPFDIMPIYR